MSNLLSLDLTSALRVAIEQSMPRMSGDSFLTNLQAADRAANRGNFAGSTSESDTETQKDEIRSGEDIFSLLSGGLAATTPEMANFDIAYTSNAKLVSGTEMGYRSTFLIIA